mmetsp:Transcript_1898/g.4543  ORF Transcript_1898/g.4543 Transcript_1898/m.4543 type:complete len:182 (+) Transcript_1898:2-547(+)
MELHMEFGTLDQQLLETIVSMPSLVSLELNVNEGFPVWSLMESDSLVALGVVGTRFHFEPRDIVHLAGRIRTNRVLRILDLEPRMPSWCMGAVVASLRFSHSIRLETFRFSCPSDNEEEGDVCMTEILKTIETTTETPLRVLWNHCSESFFVSEEVRWKTLLALRKNPTFERFRVFRDSNE